jgi:hypothetical protein
MATFRKRTNGRWQAIIRRTDLHASRSFERFVDAKSWARAIERDADLAGTLPGKMAGTLKAVIDRYEKEMWPVKKWGASKAHELVVLERDLGPRLLADLTQATLINYVRGLTISPSGIAARLSYLREVLKTARDLWSVRVPLDEVNAAIAVARRQKLAGRSLVRTRRPTESLPPSWRTPSRGRGQRSTWRRSCGSCRCCRCASASCWASSGPTSTRSAERWRCGAVSIPTAG